MRFTDGRPQLENADTKIRLGLLGTPGSAVCPLKPCQVITQGGEAGERAHLLTVHGIAPKGDVQWPR